MSILGCKFHKKMLLILFVWWLTSITAFIYEVTAGMVDSKYFTVIDNAMQKYREQTKEEHHIQLKWQRNAVGRM